MHVLKSYAYYFVLINILFIGANALPKPKIDRLVVVESTPDKDVEGISITVVEQGTFEGNLPVPKFNIPEFDFPHFHNSKQNEAFLGHESHALPFNRPTFNRYPRFHHLHHNQDWLPHGFPLHSQLESLIDFNKKQPEFLLSMLNLLTNSLENNIALDQESKTSLTLDHDLSQDDSNLGNLDIPNIDDLHLGYFPTSDQTLIDDNDECSLDVATIDDDNLEYDFHPTKSLSIPTTTDVAIWSATFDRLIDTPPIYQAIPSETHYWETNRSELPMRLNRIFHDMLYSAGLFALVLILMPLASKFIREYKDKRNHYAPMILYACDEKKLEKK
ncbi:2722_t:CDS:1 [Ambispora leptoticha]|uniref:2722_t:CDS:1 n=1 Tax=Ambispora leptoticha TaxID=144679 RepID=A0A9N8Z2J4_9GLOM|nr:2722_t:CDS:1 [Ambispora leptoticha]